MASSPFKRGDIVVYKHTRQGSEARNGSMGVCTGELDAAGDPAVKWIYWAPRVDQLTFVYGHNLEKIGELPDGTDI